MKKLSVFLLLSILLFGLLACGIADPAPAIDITSASTTTQLPLANVAPLTFDSFAAFKQHEKENPDKAVSCYYVPAELPDGYSLSAISKRDGVYVMVEYAIEVDSDATADLSEYDAQRLGTLICRYSLYTDAETALQENFIAKGYKPCDYDGKEYYRWDEHANGDVEQPIIGYEIAFLQEGDLIFLHLPALDSFENMMQLAQVEKITIE